MDSIIDQRFERVEKALATLINSLSTYNPTPAHAKDLVAADADLSRGLTQLATHQANHARILALRAQSQDLDTQIRETLSLLTTTRTALISTPATAFTDTTTPVSYTELLSYGRRISKFTLPPSYRAPDPATPTEGATTSVNTPKSGAQTNGNGTPVATNGADAGKMDLDAGGTPAPGTQPSQNTNTTLDGKMPPDYTAYLNPPPGIFYPWPSEEVIRRGALASIQVLTDKGIDPATFDPQKSAELEAERKRVQEEEDLAREEEVRREAQRRMSSGVTAGVGVAREEKKAAAFKLDTFDDEDED